MDTKSGYPFWVVKNGLLADFPPLEHDLSCEILVVGGGITGALITDHLSRHGHEVAVVEQRDIGWGSTAASTALLQYEIDEHMLDLAKRYDEPTAALAYSTCVDSVNELTKLARQVRDVGFARVDSLYLASVKRHTSVFADEHAMRERNGIPSTLLSADEVRERFGVQSFGALLTDVAASVDPYRLTSKLFSRCVKRGVQVFDRARIATIEPTSRGVTARTDRGVTIRARYVIMAGGYESQRWLDKRVARDRSSYACISDPIHPDLLGPLATTMIWESARPYHYLRTTTDHRVLVGGEDDSVDVPKRRDGRVDKRAGQLVRYTRELLPKLPIAAAYAWAGTFAETEDGLPFFGPHAQHGPRVMFAMAYGGNGITYSLLGATLLRALIERRPHPLAALYSFDRV